MELEVVGPMCPLSQALELGLITTPTVPLLKPPISEHLGRLSPNLEIATSLYPVLKETSTQEISDAFCSWRGRRNEL